jgi:hypothetical protein
MTNIPDTLDIPAFLDVRHKGKVRPIKSRSRFRHTKPQRPEGARWSSATLRAVYLYDEAPTIGAGYRSVWVSEGRKWCKLASTDGVSRTKVAMDVWAKIARRELT